MICEKYDQLTLISYYTGDISGVQRAEIDGHLPGCSVCRNVLDTLKHEQEKFLNEMPAWTRTDMTVAPKAAVRPFRHMVYAIAASLVMMVGVAIFMTDSVPYTSRIKGAEALHLYRAGVAAETIERDAAVLYTGERIQFTYSCARKRYFILAGIDGTGEVSVYFPAAGSDSMMLEPGSDMPLPNSIELDEFIGRELFVGIFSDRQLAVEGVSLILKKAFHDAGELSSIHIAVRNADCYTIAINKQRRP